MGVAVPQDDFETGLKGIADLRGHKKNGQVGGAAREVSYES